SDPTGLARRHANGARRSRGNDSGSTNQPYAAPTMLSAPAAQNGARMSIPPSRPPTAGPRMNPTPNAAPNMPKRRARSSGSVTSAMYANDVVKLEAVMPDSMRPTNSHHTVGASAMMTKPSTTPWHA